MSTTNFSAVRANQTAGVSPIAITLAAKTTYYFSVACPLQTEFVGELADGIRFHIEYGNNGGNAISTNDATYEAAWLSGKSPANHVDVSKLIGLLPAGEGQKLDSKLKALGPPAASSPNKPVQIPIAQVSQVGVVALRQARLAERPSEALPASLTWLGLTGEVLSGADLATIRTDGVTSFEARITIQANDGFKIHGIFSGVVDFGKDGYDRIKNQNLSKNVWPVGMVARFEASQPAPDIAAPRYKNQSVGAWKYDDLTRRQFVAVGTVNLDSGQPYCPANRIQFDVYALDV